MSLPIYVVGSSNTDMVIKTEKLPKPGETVLGGEFMMTHGGKGANQAVAAARLGGQVTFVANVGNDVFGRQALEQFHNENINSTFVTQDREQPSGVALIGVESTGENCIMVAPGANARLSRESVSNALASAQEKAIVLIQLEIPMEVVTYTIEKSYEKGFTVMLNPAPGQKLKAELLKMVTVITPNEYEAEILTGIAVSDLPSAQAAANKLQEFGVKNVVITLGAKGAYLHTGEVSKLIPSPKVAAVDTTAAGDCFNGALAVYLSENYALEQAVAFACKAASFSVTRLGAQPSLPFRNEI